MKSRQTLYFKEAARKYIEARTHSGHTNVSDLVGTIIRRYAVLMEDLEPDLTAEEQQAMEWIARDMMRDGMAICRADILPLRTIHHGLIRGAGANAQALEEKLDAMSDAELLAALDVAEQTI